MGPHANQDEQSIFDRKIKDIDLTGITFWTAKSFQSGIKVINELVDKNKLINEDTYCIFIAPSQKGGAKDTKIDDAATQYSVDKQTWVNFPKLMSPVTGKLDKNTCALCFDQIKLNESDIKLNLWDYANFVYQDKPLKFQLGVTAICSMLKDTSKYEGNMKSNIRDVVAIARLKQSTPIAYIKKEE